MYIEKINKLIESLICYYLKVKHKLLHFCSNFEFIDNFNDLIRNL